MAAVRNIHGAPPRDGGRAEYNVFPDGGVARPCPHALRMS